MSYTQNINKLLWVRRYALIVVRGCYLFGEANSWLKDNLELQGTDNVQCTIRAYFQSQK